MADETAFSRCWQAIHDGLNPESKSRTARLFRGAQNLILLIGLSDIILGTVADFRSRHAALLTVIDVAVALIYFAEYFIRLWQAPLDFQPRGSPRDSAITAAQLRLRWATSPLGVMDLLAAAPIPLALLLGVAPQNARLFGILWVLKLVRYTPAFGLFARVVRNERQALYGVSLALLMVMILAATAAFLLERNMPGTGFTSIPGALWWAVATVTTTGYGDVVPVTLAGRILGGLTMFCGILMLAMWAGILAGGFYQEVRRRDFLQTWDLVARGPMFQSLGAATIAEVARLLRTQEFAAGRTVIREHDAGDCMYFIADGEVEVRLTPDPVIIGAGGFFGEMALITGEPRSATVVTTRQTTLLRLDVADFRGLTAGHPDLIQAIGAAAEERGQYRAGQART